MKATSFAGCLTILLFLLLLSTIAAAEDTATVHSVVYDWSTLAPLDNVIIEVNSTPMQSIVAKYGMYSFDLPEGNYCITASYYVNGDLTCYDEANITITDEGNYVVDLLLVPSYSDNNSEEIINSTPDLSSYNILTISVIAVLILLVSLVYKVRSPEKTSTKKNRRANVSNGHANKSNKVHKVNNNHSGFVVVVEDQLRSKTIMEHQSSTVLSSEQQEILDIIRSAGGTMPQKELRKYLSYSEGKASVMILELEKRGHIRKVKKGRGNILFLTEMEL